jgi:hypothetical protein
VPCAHSIVLMRTRLVYITSGAAHALTRMEWNLSCVDPRQRKTASLTHQRIDSVRTPARKRVVTQACECDTSAVRATHSRQHTQSNIRTLLTRQHPIIYVLAPTRTATSTTAATQTRTHTRRDIQARIVPKGGARRSEVFHSKCDSPILQRSSAIRRFCNVLSLRL